MDFVRDLPMMRCKQDDILVIVNKLTKFSHFILGSLKDGSSVLARKFVQEIFWLHGIAETIISYRNTHMTSQFWTTLNSTLGTRLNFNTTYHPKKDGQIE